MLTQVKERSQMIDPYDAKLHTEIELLKKDQEQLKQIFTRLDISVEKLADAATNISKILALHEQRTEIMADDIAFFRESHVKFFDAIDNLKKDVATENIDRDKKIDELEKHKWITIGIATAIGFVVNNLQNIPHLISK